MSPELQSAVAAAVRSGDPQSVAAVLDASALGAARTRAALHLHASTTRDTLTEALRDSYPTVAKLMSAGRFAKLAAEFVRTSPPRRASLWFWGEDFAAFLAEQGADETAVACARLDRAWHESFAAAEAAPMAAGELAALPADALAETRLRLHPAARLLTLPAGALAAWRAATDLPCSDAAAAHGDLHALIARPGSQVGLLVMDAAEQAFLAALDAGAPLLAAFETATTADETFDPQSALARLIAAGAFQSLSPEKDPSDV